MIDHVSLAVADLKRSVGFYESTLSPLGLTLIVREERRAGFGKRYPEFWVNLRPGLAPQPDDTGTHICLRAPSRAAVEAIHRAALQAGGRSDGPPRDRQATTTGYFAAFVRDPDGNKIEAATFPRSP